MKLQLIFISVIFSLLLFGYLYGEKLDVSKPRIFRKIVEENSSYKKTEFEFRGEERKWEDVQLIFYKVDAHLNAHLGESYTDDSIRINNFEVLATVLEKEIKKCEIIKNYDSETNESSHQLYINGVEIITAKTVIPSISAGYLVPQQKLITGYPYQFFLSEYDHAKTKNEVSEKRSISYSAFHIGVIPLNLKTDAEINLAQLFSDGINKYFSVFPESYDNRISKFLTQS